MLERLKRKLFSLQVLVLLKPCINGTQTLLIRENLIDGMLLFSFSFTEVVMIMMVHLIYCDRLLDCFKFTILRQ